MAKTTQKLLDLEISKIKKNPENPRFIFREDELTKLRDSIFHVGIKVPLSVFEDGNVYKILDGERRWICAKKLNYSTVPAIVQPKPTKLQNILTMFNIHNVRVEWDLIAIALKLGEIRTLLQKEKKPAEPAELAMLSGISPARVRDCLELLNLPAKYRKMLIDEARKPKKEQHLTPDLFVEILKSQRVIKRYVPEVFDGITPRKYLDSMVSKYKKGVVKSVVAFRNVSKIARAKRTGKGHGKVAPILRDLVEEKDYSIEEAFTDTVEDAYIQRDIDSRSRALLEKLRKLRTGRKLSQETKVLLRDLAECISRLVGE